MKKEERGKLLAKLRYFFQEHLTSYLADTFISFSSKNKFESSQLLYSSKAFGKSESAREQLKRQLLEEKSGLSNISHHAQSSHSLYVHSNTEKITAEKQQQQEEEYDDMIDEEGSSNSEDEEIQESVKALPPISLINQAFGGALLKTSAADCYDTSKCHSVSSTSTSAKAAAAVVEVNAEDRSMENIASKPTISVSIPIPTFGSALKTSSSSSDNKSSLATKKVKLEHTQQQHEFHQDSSDYSSDEEENDEANNNVSNATRSLSSTATVASTIAAAGKWTSDVVSGEKYSTPTATSTPSLAIRLPTTTFRTPLLSTPAFHVPIDRPESIKAHRMNLPVVAEEQPIMEAILSNDVTILCGATGSGKTTQVPQFLYEAGFGDPKHPLFPGMVGITQPRRVAAVSMAHRVAEEMGLVLDGEEERVAAVSSSFKRKANSCVVGYQVRYDSTTVGPATRIKFMTDGILLRELSSAVTGDGIGSGGGSGAGLLLPQYSCIVLDEAHERTVGTDVLIGWLSRIVSLRNSGKVQGVLPLKIVIMSATLRVDDFTGGVPACTSPHTEEAILADGSSSVQNKDPSTTSTTGPPSSARSSQLFATPPPVIKVDGRQYKVVVHYNKRTPQVDYVSEVLRKVSKIHTTLPRGGILVFVTGQMEVQVLVRKLQSRFNSLSSGSGGSRRRHEDNKKTSRDYGKEMIDRNGDDDEEDTDTDEVEENGDDFDGMGSDSEEEDVEVMDGEEGDEEEEPLDRGKYYLYQDFIAIDILKCPSSIL